MGQSQGGQSTVTQIPNTTNRGLHGTEGVTDSEADNKQEEDDSEQEDDNGQEEEQVADKDNEQEEDSNTEEEESEKDDEQVTDKEPKKGSMDQQQYDDYGIYFTEESSEGEDLFNVQAMQRAKSTLDDLNSGSGRQVKEQQDKKSTVAKDKGKEAMKDVHKNAEEELSDGLHSLPPSDDDTCRPSRGAEFDANTMDDPQLKVGLLFKDVHQFKKVLKNYTIKDSRDIAFIKNEKTRVTVECKQRCGWRLHASQVTGETSFQIKTFKKAYKCGKSFMNKQVTAKWLSKKYMENLRSDSD
uniref:YTH domain-containing protein 1-like n=1 Tax=Elaeis guineensis var. tenera TaxID=51953 RepID=A0A6I9SLZ1_ELAGV|nr:YTH domain-containing protein 1-like [Elaeis guineensis]